MEVSAAGVKLPVASPQGRAAKGDASAPVGDQFVGTVGPTWQELVSQAAVMTRNSPDGKSKAVFDGSSPSLTVVDAAGKHSLNGIPGRVQSFHWLDKQRLLVQADNFGDERGRLYLAFADGSGSQPLASGSNHQELCFRQGNQLFFRSDDRELGHFDLLCYDLSTGECQTVVRGTGDLDYQGALASGGWLATRQLSNTKSEIVAIGSDGSERGYFSGAKNKVLRQQDDGQVLLLSNDGGEFMCPRLLNLQTGQSRTLLSAGADVEQVSYSPDQSRLAAVINRGGISEVQLYSAATGQQLDLPPLQIPAGVIYHSSFKDDHTLKFGINTSAAPSRNGEVDLPSGQVRWQKEMALKPGPQLVEYSSSDGQKIPAFYYRPTGLPADQPLPTVIQLHGGPDSQFRPRFDPMIEELTSHGVAVLAPNVRGSTGYGQSYADADNGIERKKAVADVLAAGDYLRSSGLASNIGLFGHSYGGYLVLAALAAGGKFSAGVDQAGPSDLTHELQDQNSPYREEFGSDPAVLRELSPIYSADKIQTPLMLVHGRMDSQVSNQESIQMRQALEPLGATVKSLELPMEGHMLADPRSKIDTVEQMAEFLIEHLNSSNVPPKSPT